MVEVNVGSKVLLVALLAAERLLSGVTPLVLLQVRRLLERPGT